MVQIRDVTIEITMPNEKNRYPFIPGQRTVDRVKVSKTFHSREEMAEGIPDILGNLGDIWEDT